ncbi:hypothetical protein NM208_g6483 [Fusarium decemcellulare]|uniref:Uncharacterized protein n=1 Tax=Fusarium decemcellulare TaxID=57161 RepID=A0ACC1SCX9_9HYPO|nr:hypothetical protein NM208_g6483 [Fusarium decemcellulare]
MAGNGRRRSHFSDLAPIALDGPFALDKAFQADTREAKVNLSIGVYRGEDGSPWMLSSVMKAKQRLKLETLPHEYLPLQGSKPFLDLSRKLVLGETLSNQVQLQDAARSIQTISGTGANSLVARFLGKYSQPSNVWLPDPTWDNHVRIWAHNAPDVTIRHYPYYDQSTRSFDFEGMMRAIRREAKANDVMLLHACAHNPTGIDPSRHQWKAIAELCDSKDLFVVFDLAYQGFASGSPDEDAWAVRHFVSQHPSLELAICQSFSKNLGLYGERAGALHFVVSRTYTAASACGDAVMGTVG